MRKLELEMEERRAEREDRQEERILALFANLMHPMTGGYIRGPPFQQGIIDYPQSTQPLYLNAEQLGNISYPENNNA